MKAGINTLSLMSVIVLILGASYLHHQADDLEWGNEELKRETREIRMFHRQTDLETLQRHNSINARSLCRFYEQCRLNAEEPSRPLAGALEGMTQGTPLADSWKLEQVDTEAEQTYELRFRGSPEALSDFLHELTRASMPLVVTGVEIKPVDAEIPDYRGLRTIRAIESHRIELRLSLPELPKLARIYHAAH